MITDDYLPKATRQHNARQVALDWQKSLSGGGLLPPSGAVSGAVSGDEVNEGIIHSEPEVIPAYQQAERDR